MRLPQFRAEASLYERSGQYRTYPTASPSGHVVATALWDPPQISVTYIPPPYPYGHGFPGTLIVAGENFTPNSMVHLEIDNCHSGLDATDVPTTPSSSGPCRDPLHCYWYPGGQFGTSIPCFCGGTATVAAIDASGPRATGTVDLVPCL